MGYFSKFLIKPCEIIAVMSNSRWPTSRRTENTKMFTETEQEMYNFEI